MTIWESGRESSLLDAIIAGRKTIEGRLNKGKFAEYRVDDIVELRRDYRDENGVLRDGEQNAARVKIVGIRTYKSFLQMVQAEGYAAVIPDATSAEEAASEYDRFYSAEDQAQYGVLAIEIVPVVTADSWNTAYQAGQDYQQIAGGMIDQLASFYPTSLPRTALDVGCGTGYLARQVAERGFDVLGIDPSSEAIAKAEVRDRVTYLVGDIETVDGTFGLITCKLVYAFIEDKPSFLRAVADRLETGGFFVLIAPVHQKPVNHKKGIHVDGVRMIRDVRKLFRIVHRQHTAYGYLIVGRKRLVDRP